MTENNRAVLNRIKGGLIVSCQALKEEPMYGSYLMSRMADAAMRGGAVGIRANTIADIIEIKKTVKLPVIGIIKEVYGDCPVYITPTMKEIDMLAECGVDIIATDATDSGRRPRPDGKTLEVFFEQARKKYPDQLFMADCSGYGEGIHAARLGFDLIGTTLRGYTEDTKGVELPDIDLVERLAGACGKPVIAEGGIWLPDQLKAALDAGAWAAVIGGAITRPMDITKRFVSAIQ